MKLNLGCGDLLFDDYINCDLYNSKADLQIDCRILPYEDNSVEEIQAIHLLEHFDYQEAQDILKEWYRALIPGGKLIIETPDLLNSCISFVEGSEQDRVDLYGHFFSTPWIDGQMHKFLYTENQLGGTLLQVGFRNIIREAALRFPERQYINLRMVAEK